MNATATRLDGRPRRRRRFLLFGIAGLAVLAAALGISFTADTGTATITVTAGQTSGLVFPVADGAELPDGVDFSLLQWGTTIDNGPDPNTVTTADSPSWSPVANTAGTITTPGEGDIFVVDGRTASAGGASNVVLTLYITNLAALQASYSSYAWPIKVYQADAAGGIVSSWSKVTSPFDTDAFFLTHTSGFLTYTVPTGANRFYLITMDSGGSYYTTSTSGTLGPAFYLVAQAS